VRRVGWNRNIHYHDVVLDAVPAGCVRALDVGCGGGRLAASLADRCDDVVAIDADASTLARARSTHRKTNLGFVAGDVMTHDFGGAFDFIASIATLHHLPLEPALERFKQLLQPRGTLAVIGLYRLATVADIAYAHVAIPVSAWHRATKGAEPVAAPIQDPQDTQLDSGAFVRRLQTTPAAAQPLRAERRRISSEITGFDRDAVLALARELIESGIPRFVAYELTLYHQPTFETLRPSDVMRLSRGLNHWGDIDSFACFITGPAWRAGRLLDARVRKWTLSRDWVWRRVAAVSTVPLNSRARGGKGDARRTLMICRRLVDDPHDLVQKAVSWALRELAKREPDSVRRFLAANRARVPARVRRDVENKLATGRKRA
jgi:SAM-dependent methyltransferase